MLHAMVTSHRNNKAKKLNELKNVVYNMNSHIGVKGFKCTD